MTAPIALATLHAGYHHTSLALASIAAYWRERHAEAVRVHDWQLKGDRSAMLETLRRQHPRILGLSIYLWNLDAMLALARDVKALMPDCILVLGGPEAGPRALELLAAEPALDYVVDGEGEAAFAALGDWLLHGQGCAEAIPGLAWRAALGPQCNPPRAVPVEDLPDLRRMGLAHDRKLVYWETSRGCPFRCSFCSSCSERLRQFPMTRIDTDLAVLRGLRGKTVKLLDRSFHLGRQRTLDLLNRFLDTPQDLRFHLELNPDRISDAAMALFAAAPAGKFQFEIGLQTLNPEVLRTIDRDMDVEASMARLRQLIGQRRHPVHLDLIAGLPGENAASFRDSLDRTFALYPDHLQLGLLKLLPGTPLRDQAPGRGYVWQHEAPYTVIRSDAMDAASLQRFAEHAELLERLWNSGWMRASLRAWVERHCAGSVSTALDHLLDGDAGALLQRAPAPRVFGRLCELLAPALAADAVLRECLLWDYACRERPGATTPDWIRQTWAVHKGRPLLSLGEQAATYVSSARVETIEAGRYRVELQHHRPGRPVELVRLE